MEDLAGAAVVALAGLRMGFIVLEQLLKLLLIIVTAVTIVPIYAFV